MCKARAWLLGVGSQAWLGAAEARRGAMACRGAAELLQLASIDVPVAMGLLEREGSLRAHTKSHEPQQWILLSREQCSWAAHSAWPQATLQESVSDGLTCTAFNERFSQNNQQQAGPALQDHTGTPGQQQQQAHLGLLQVGPSRHVSQREAAGCTAHGADEVGDDRCEAHALACHAWSPAKGVLRQEVAVQASADKAGDSSSQKAQADGCMAPSALQARFRGHQDILIICCAGLWA